jgi:regulator of protease activity HflC (stomatin/prohibitin superfamily)
MAGGWVGLVIAALIVFLPIFIWFFCRIEPHNDQIAILIRKTGKDLPSGEILAVEKNQKGVNLDVLPEGRYFRNPYTWDWKMSAITDIPAGKLGVVTRLYGKELPHGRILAEENTKGIVTDILRPGKYRINPYAFEVNQFDAITIKPGCCGVVTMLVGSDVLASDIPEDKRNTFLVPPEMKGVVAAVLDPGSYYLNPYIYNVVEVNLQSQRFAMSGEDAISFLTQDGFSVAVEGTIEYSLQPDKAALLTHRVGDMDDIVKKIILPKARGFSRIEGSKHPAINFIMGETRQKFQSDLEIHLRTRCEDWGVAIKSVLIRNIIPPDAIASVIRDREIAVQESKKYEQELLQAKSKAELVKQEMLAQQSKEKVESETAQIRAVISAQQDQAVRVIAAEKELAVAKVENQAADSQVAAVLLRAEAERDVIRMRNEADAGVLHDRVLAFGGGMGLARYQYLIRLGPRIDSILTTDGDEGLGSVFRSYLTIPGKDVPK